MTSYTVATDSKLLPVDILAVDKWEALFLLPLLNLPDERLTLLECVDSEYVEDDEYCPEMDN